MGLGASIKGVFRTVGVGYNIVRPLSAAVFSKEYLDYEDSKGRISPFFAEHLLEVNLPYDTAASVTDRLDLDDGRQYLIAHKNPEIFQNECASYHCILYKCNVTLTVSRVIKTGPSYDPVPTWPPVYSNVLAMWADSMPSAFSDEIQAPVQGVGRDAAFFYVQKPFNVKLKDRITVVGYAKGPTPTGVLNYEVEQIDDATYTGLSLYICRQDVRL